MCGAIASCGLFDDFMICPYIFKRRACFQHPAMPFNDLVIYQIQCMHCTKLFHWVMMIMPHLHTRRSLMMAQIEKLARFSNFFATPNSFPQKSNLRNRLCPFNVGHPVLYLHRAKVNLSAKNAYFAKWQQVSAPGHPPSRIKMGIACFPR